jgi:serine protease AprX
MNMKGTPSRADDVIASYSSKGPTLYDHVIKPDLVAPGNQVVSVDTTAYGESTSLPYLYPQTIYASSCPYCYIRISGTSMAAPMVSGAAAILLQKTPSLTPDQVKARLMKTAYKTLPLYSTATDPVTGVTYNSQSDIFTVGAGYLDIQAALANTDLAPATVGSALSPTVTKDASGNIVLVNASGVIWGGSVMWGTGVVWGTGVIWGTNVSGQSVLWGSGVCWGSSTLQGYGVIWGTGVVWGTSSTPAGEATGILINGEN